MYFSRLYFHLMWTMDNGQHSLKGHAQNMGNYLMAYSEKKGIDSRLITVMSNHIHCLVRMNTAQSISDIVQLLKGRSSTWMSENTFLPYKFKWEDEYFAFSIGYSQLAEFEKYFVNQMKYHETHSVKSEIQALNERYKLNYK